jgi:hypothetical protein
MAHTFCDEKVKRGQGMDYVTPQAAVKIGENENQLPEEQTI